MRSEPQAQPYPHHTHTNSTHHRQYPRRHRYCIHRNPRTTTARPSTVTCPARTSNVSGPSSGRGFEWIRARQIDGCGICWLFPWHRRCPSPLAMLGAPIESDEYSYWLSETIDLTLIAVIGISASIILGFRYSRARKDFGFGDFAP